MKLIRGETYTDINGNTFVYSNPVDAYSNEHAFLVKEIKECELANNRIFNYDMQTRYRYVVTFIMKEFRRLCPYRILAMTWKKREDERIEVSYNEMTDWVRLLAGNDIDLITYRIKDSFIDTADEIESDTENEKEEQETNDEESTEQETNETSKIFVPIADTKCANENLKHVPEEFNIYVNFDRHPDKYGLYCIHLRGQGDYASYLYNTIMPISFARFCFGTFHTYPRKLEKVQKMLEDYSIDSVQVEAFNFETFADRELAIKLFGEQDEYLYDRGKHDGCIVLKIEDVFPISQ